MSQTRHAFFLSDYEKVRYDVQYHSMIILYPTETVYGLGANVFDPKSMEDLYTLKGRDEKKMVSWLVRDIADIERYADMNEVSAKIAERFLPGPLTLVLPLKEAVRTAHNIPSETIGFRVSSDLIAERVIADFMNVYDAPLSCTSANVSGMPPLGTVEDILEQFGEKRAMIDFVHDGGERVGKTSTVVEVSNGNITLFREGDITFSQICALF
jgi:L-threonylcarbamoyladenylate synthase